MLGLAGGRIEVVLARRLHLRGRSMRLDARATIEAGVALVDDGVVFDDGAILVHVGYVHAAEVGHGAVVSKYAAAPLAASAWRVLLRNLRLVNPLDIGVSR